MTPGDVPLAVGYAHTVQRVRGMRDTPAVLFSVSPPRDKVHSIFHQRQKRNIKGALGERGRASSQVEAEARACAIWKTGAPRGRRQKRRASGHRTYARTHVRGNTHKHARTHTHSHTHIIRLRGHHLVCSHLRDVARPRGQLLVPTPDAELLQQKLSL
jgi:hypothetical protein